MKPRAYGYLHKDIAADQRQRQEYEIQVCARGLGYDLARTIIDSFDGPGFAQLLRCVATPETTGVVITPNLKHLTGGRADMVRLYAPIVTTTPQHYWAKTDTVPSRHPGTVRDDERPNFTSPGS